MPDVKSIQLKTKELLTYHCHCQGNLVTMATRYVADGFILRKLHTNMTSIELKTKELLHNTVVAMVTKLP